MKCETHIDPMAVASRAASSPWHAKTFVAIDELVALSRHTLKQHEALHQIATACRNAEKLGATLAPETLVTFLIENQLIAADAAQESSHGQVHHQG